MLFKGAAGWMGDPDIPLKGFPWKGGAERDTSGILMWSEPFEVLLPSGEKVSVVCCSCIVYFSRLAMNCCFFCILVNDLMPIFQKLRCMSMLYG